MMTGLLELERTSVGGKGGSESGSEARGGTVVQGGVEKGPGAVEEVKSPTSPSTKPVVPKLPRTTPTTRRGAGCSRAAVGSEVKGGADERNRLKRRQLHQQQELAAHARRLEEKVKGLEKKTREVLGAEKRRPINLSARQSKDASPFLRQEARERELQRQVRIRERQIELLKQKLRQFTGVAGCGKNGEIVVQDTLELEQVITRVSKERLQLERHLQVASELQPRRIK
ncbi:uncharacterized protein [Hetaerina americana]|uniref:uncharacterized protein n=1 Tax=Hetaerina americana TaxID=62018 RepID=UPI003A7F2934